jgi:L-fuconolactonase
MNMPLSGTCEAVEPQIGDRSSGTVDANLAIVDAHHHLWDRAPWDQELPPYLFGDLLADITESGHAVVQTIFVECGWGRDSLDSSHERAGTSEVALARGAAEESERLDGPTIAGIVGFADLRMGKRTGAILDEMAAAGNSRLVGVRDRIAWDSDPAVPRSRANATAALMLDPQWRRGFGEIGHRGLVFDSWIYHPQLGELADLARAFPDTPIVLNHMGGPLNVGSHGRFRNAARCSWREGMSQLSQCENVHVKLGGMGAPVLRRATETKYLSEESGLSHAWGDDIRWCIETFGVNRCMFESNFPVDKSVAHYGSLWNVFKGLTADASVPEREALFSRTASHVYHLPSQRQPLEGELNARIS